MARAPGARSNKVPEGSLTFWALGGYMGPGGTKGVINLGNTSFADTQD